MTARITKLTAEQSALLYVVRDEWLAHGLSTQPANRAEAEEGVQAAYRAAGLEPPRFLIWLGSPMAGVIGQALLPGILQQVWAQVGDQVWDQVGDQVWAQVWAQVGDQVWAQVGAQVRDQVRDQVRAQVWAQVRAQVGDQVWDQVGDQVGAQVGDQVRDQVRAQVRDQVRDQVRAQVGDQVRDQVRDQVWAQVRDQVWAQVRAQVKNRLDHWTSGLLYGQQEAGFYSFYDTMDRLGVEGLEPVRGQRQVAQNCGWWWCFEKAAILTERPVLIRRDPQGRLHCADGPAIAYRDGWGGYYWHGTLVPDDLILSGGWDLPRIMKERNTEVRRCAIELTGWDQFTDQLSLVSECPDPGNDGHTIALYDLPAGFNLYEQPARILLCTNGTEEKTGERRRFGLPVPATHSDPIEAVADMYGWPVEAYRRLEVRR